jgi:Amt family ammonium transporter
MGGGIGQLGAQFLGVITVGGITVLLSTIFWLALKVTLGIRVSSEEELVGLDIGEHGMEAYSGFLKEGGVSDQSVVSSSSPGMVSHY